MYLLNVFCHLHLVYDSIIVSKPFAENIKFTLKRFDGIGRFFIGEERSSVFSINDYLILIVIWKVFSKYKNRTIFHSK